MEKLRKKAFGKQTQWSLEEIQKGLEYFKTLNGRYPTSREIDKFDYLPSARSIQRSHKGLVSMRTSLGFDEAITNYTKGAIRSDKAKETYVNAVDYESKFYEYLISKIPEVRVHEHKILRPGHVCCDFFIYTSNKRGYAVDIFYAQDSFTLQSIIRIKSKRYQNLKFKVYFILVGNDSITQQEIDNLMENKKIPLEDNIKVLIESEFKTKYLD